MNTIKILFIPRDDTTQIAGDRFYFALSDPDPIFQLVCTIGELMIHGNLFIRLTSASTWPVTRTAKTTAHYFKVSYESVRLHGFNVICTS